ncbi:MAG: hypothetical protein HY277_07540, partial [Ignavibacteriales bacterium]|nr:hypothetical protein [Ignavibacteriales bacterium]
RKSGKTVKTWADSVGGVSGFSIGWGLGTDLSKKSDQVNKPSTTAFYVVGGILMIPAIILEINGNNAIKRSAYIYDDHLKGSPDDSALQQIRFSPLYDARRQEFGFQINFELH